MTSADEMLAQVRADSAKWKGLMREALDTDLAAMYETGSVSDNMVLLMQILREVRKVNGHGT